jgi:SAM-dependent methyltransferase
MGNWKHLIPKPIRVFLNQIRGIFVSKYSAELGFWKKKYKEDKGIFRNAHFEKIMLGMAEETSQTFLKNKVIADFGCGPRGSLNWVTSANIKIGIDVLANLYAENFPENLINHGMIYVKNTEKTIPLPSESVDILFTLNAIDHVDCFECMCKELLRIVKYDGLIIASFNLEEAATPFEPQRLTEEIIQEQLLQHLDVISYRISHQGPEDDPYRPFFTDKLAYTKGEEGYLWVKARKL